MPAFTENKKQPFPCMPGLYLPCFSVVTLSVPAVLPCSRMTHSGWMWEPSHSTYSNGHQELILSDEHLPPMPSVPHGSQPQVFVSKDSHEQEGIVCEDLETGMCSPYLAAECLASRETSARPLL